MASYLRPEPIGPFRYGVDPLDGDWEHLAFEDTAPKRLKIWGPRNIFCGGHKVSPVNMPTRLTLARRKGRLIDFDNAGQMFMVTQRFVDLVESFVDGGIFQDL